MADTASAYLLEASWEVCNKAGGIHTVITSKLSSARAVFRERYLVAGPWIGEHQRALFKETDAPSHLAPALLALEKRGVKARYGIWLVPEEQPIVLLSWEGLIGELNRVKSQLWESHKLDTLGSDFYDVDQPLLWAHAVGMLAEELADAQPKRELILHAHEWLTGTAVLSAKRPNLKTIFTTHATVLGRALSSRDVFIYDKLDALDPAGEASRLGVVTKHQIEMHAARSADVFTTVSAITAREAEAFLGRKAEVITENGIDASALPDYDFIAAKRLQMRAVLDAFVSSHFFPNYRFDLSKARYQFTMGRYETHNKGYDLYLKSLANLDAKLRAEKSAATVVSFILVPSDPLRVKPEIAQRLSVFRQIRSLLGNYAASLPSQLAAAWWDGARSIPLTPQLSERMEELRSRIPSLPTPPVCLFDLRSGEDDIVRLARENGLVNGEDNRVKVVYLPTYLDGFDGVFDLPLYEIISGCDLGVFPSLYEPWGYTPMEGLMMGAPVITSTLAGFGVAAESANITEGVISLNRSRNDFAAETADLTALLAEATEMNARSLSRDRFNAYEAALKFGWDRLYAKYLEAYNQA